MFKKSLLEMALKKSSCQKKNVLSVKETLCGEKSGKKPGMKLNIAQRDVEGLDKKMVEFYRVRNT